MKLANYTQPSTTLAAFATDGVVNATIVSSDASKIVIQINSDIRVALQVEVDKPLPVSHGIAIAVETGEFTLGEKLTLDETSFEASAKKQSSKRSPDASALAERTRGRDYGSNASRNAR